jgi:hypothetical protein
VIAKIAGFSDHARFAFQRKLLFYAVPAPKKYFSENIIDRCIMALIDYTRSQRKCRLILLSYDSRHISLFQEKYGFSRRSEFLVDLTKDQDILGKDISRNVRRDYKKAVSHGYVFKESMSADMAGPLKNLMEETRKMRISKGYSDYNYFYINGLNERTFARLIQKNVIHFYYVERDSEIFAIQAVMEINNRAYALLIGVTPVGYEHGLPSFIDYCLILSLKKKNYSYVNFGGVPIDKTHQGLADFKRRLGAVQHYSSYGSTHFLIFPYNLLNPLVRLLRQAPENPAINYLKNIINH